MIITLLTDFGDFYPGVMKGVILSLAPEAKIVDITHSVEPQNVFQGAFLLYHSYRFFKKAIHVAVVDPEVGGRRRAIVVETRDHFFVAPDNGIAYPSANEEGISKIYEIDQKISEIVGELSTTFHGRDLFAPSSALILRKDFSYFREIDEIKTLDLFDYSLEGENLRARVVYVDRFGNLITNVPAKALKGAKGFNLLGVEFPMVRTYSDVHIGEPLALIGSFGMLELSVRNGNASELLKIRSGSIELEVLR
ncbi:MAG: S-adenosyl-l-methionine hydroxide adenosyltransferase family protein [Archaeoglobaceae archaeon]|nr:S-adenosyl-l-methionine hydroxide adenosyltransferase family protein [Archaeoglobaceae archaeon]MDW8118424.1 S-adenosyl-l-methionine hydroxide adenosyltransferase family protein [Archaeoglobaceae archaeon]